MCATHGSSLVMIHPIKKLVAVIMVLLLKFQCWLYALCFVFWCELLWHPPGAQFSEQVLLDNFVKHGAGNDCEFSNCETTILRITFPHKLHKVVRNDGKPPTALLAVHMLSTYCKFSTPSACS